MDKHSPKRLSLIIFTNTQPSNWEARRWETPARQPCRRKTREKQQSPHAKYRKKKVKKNYQITYTAKMRRTAQTRSALLIAAKK